MRQRPRCMSSGRLPYRQIRLKPWGSPMVASVQFLAHVSAVSMNNLLHWSILPLVAYKPYTQTESFALFLAHVSAALIKNLLHWSILPLVAYTNIHWRLVCFIYENFIVFLFFCPSLLTVYLKPVYFLKSGLEKWVRFACSTVA